jgi:hypothetical protein
VSTMRVAHSGQGIDDMMGLVTTIAGRPTAAFPR